MDTYRYSACLFLDGKYNVTVYSTINPPFKFLTFYTDKIDREAAVSAARRQGGVVDSARLKNGSVMQEAITRRSIVPILHHRALVDKFAIERFQASSNPTMKRIYRNAIWQFPERREEQMRILVETISKD